MRSLVSAKFYGVLSFRGMTMLYKKFKLRLPVIALVFCSILFWETYDRYEPVGPALLTTPSLSDATRVKGDCVEEAPHVFKLHVPEVGKTARLNVSIPNATDYSLIRIRGRIKVEGVEEGHYSWSCARLLLAQYDKEGIWIPVHHTLRAESGTQDWAIHENVFKLQPNGYSADRTIGNSSL